MRFRLAITTAALAVSITAANADQLDAWCAQVKLPSSIALCSDPELRALAEERQRAFDDARGRIGQERANQLLDDQKGWVASYPKACGIAPNVPPPLPLAPEVRDCMARAARARIAYLHSYGETPGVTAGQTSPPGAPTASNPPLAAGTIVAPPPAAPGQPAAPTPLVRYYQTLGSNCSPGVSGCPPNPMHKCADPATPDDADFCLHYMLTQNGLSRPEDIEAALGRPLYEKYMALKAEGIRLAREKQVKQVQEADSPHPAVAYTGIPWIAGALICPDVPTLTLVIDLFQGYYEDYLKRRAFSEEQARIYYGAPISKPDPKTYGCVLVPSGTPLTRVRIVLAYPFVRSVDPIDGVQVEGITFPTMIR